MQLIRNALDPHHIQRTHLNEMNCAFRCDFRYANWGKIDVLLYRSYLIILNLKLYVKHKLAAHTLTN